MVVEVNDALCAAATKKPEQEKSCGGSECVEWNAGPWKKVTLKGE